MEESPVKPPQTPSITRTMEESPAHACDHCSTITTRQCSASHANSSSVGGCPLFTFYCSDSCRQQDGAKHQEKCEQLEARNKLFVIARTIQDCWLTIRRSAWDHDVKHVHLDESETKGIVICELGEGGEVSGGNIFHQFDESVVEGLHTDFGLVRDAVFASGTSEHAVACLYKLAEYLLQDLTTEVLEIQISPGVPLLVVQGFSSSSPPSHSETPSFSSKHESNHWVYKITAKTGEEFALDITADQYGDDCVLCPWDLITITHEHRIFGESHARLHNVLNTNFSSQKAAHREIKWSHLSSCLDRFVQKLQEKKFQGPLRREGLVETLNTYLKDLLPLDCAGDYKEWVTRHSDTLTSSAKMSGATAPSVVPMDVHLCEEIPVAMTDVPEQQMPDVPEDEYEKYLREGRVKCVLL